MATTDLPRPEPVTRAATVAGAVAAILIAVGGLARGLGWLSDDFDVATVARQASDLILGAAALWSTLAPLVLALRARDQVTPLADPRDAAGTPLTPVVDDDEPGQHTAPPAVPEPVVDPAPTTLMPVVLPPVPTVEAAPVPPPVEATPVEPTPIADATAAAVLTDTLPAAAIRG